MEDYQLESIAPYSDEEAVEALGKVANHPSVPWISKYIFPNQPETYLRDILKSIHSIDEFQSIGVCGSLPDLFEGGIRPAIGDVFGDRAVEQQRLLRNIGDLTPQADLCHF